MDIFYQTHAEAISSRATSIACVHLVVLRKTNVEGRTRIVGLFS